MNQYLEFNYIDCFTQAIRESITKGLLPSDYQSSVIYYEDLPALLHINRLMNGISKEHRLTYLIVDEAQDYMPYEIVEMNALTDKNGLMLIGDLGQNLASGKYNLSTETFRDGSEVEWVKTNKETEEQRLIEVLEDAIFEKNSNQLR